MMKNRLTKRMFQMAALALAMQLVLAVAPARAQLDETCKVLVNNQIVQVGFGGEFRLRNIPAGNNFVRLYAICTKAGVTRYGRSVFYQVRNRESIVLSELDFVWRNTPFPTTAAIIAVADNATLSQINDTTQIRVTAVLSDSTQKNVTARGFGSSYTSSNPSVASVDLQGRVTANGIGTALITVNNEGATAVTRITVAPANLLTTVEGLVQLESGAAAIGATVVVPGFGETIVTDTTGKFSFSGIYAPLGSLKARAYNMVNNQLLLGLTGNLRLIQGGITDAGIIVIKPVINYVYWKDAVNGAWNDATKWSTNAVPAANDNVFIGVPGNITVTNSTTTTIKSLLCDESFTLSGGSFAVSDSSEMTSIFTFSGGTLAGNGALTIFGALIWSGGTMAAGGSTNVAASGLMDLSTATAKFSNRTINNFGTNTVSGAGNFNISSGSSFNNQVGGIFVIGSDGNIFGNGSFNNMGTLRKTGTTGITTFNGPRFNNNSGTVDMLTGTLNLFSGGTSTGGIFTVASGASLLFNVVTHVFSGAYSGSGTGLIQLTGTIQINANGATFNFTGGGFQWSSGTISGPGALTNTGNFNMTGPFSNKILRGGATINNSGTVTWTSTGTIFGGEGSVFNNQAGGTFDIRDNAFFDGDGIGGNRTVFINAGRIVKSAGTSTSTLEVTFNNNNGTIEAQIGTLALTAGGNNTGGTFTVADTANLNLSSGNFVYTRGTLNVTSGALNLSGGTHKFSGNYSGSGVGSIQLSGGTLQIDTTVVATFNFTGGGFQWSSGTISGPGALTNTGNFNMTGPFSNKIFRSGATINNSGTVTWTGTGTIFGGERTGFNNLASGTFDIRVDAFFDGDGIGGTRTVFINAGRIVKSAGTSTSTLEVTFNNNNGTIEAQIGTLALTAGGNNTGGTFTVADTANLNLSSGNFVYTRGTLNVTSGALNLSGGTHKFSGNYSGSGVGSIQLSGGTLQIDTTVVATFNFTGGGFQWSSGTISGPGALTNTGNFNMTGPFSNKIFRSGATINNSGTVTWTGTGTIFGGERTGFNNLASGTFDIRVDAFFDGDGIGGTRTVFNNVGSVIKSAGASTATLEVTFNNANGNINVQTGILTLSAGGNKAGGTFTVATGANLNFSGTHVFSGSFSGAIDGIVDFGTFQIDPAGVTLNFPGQGFTWNSGTILGSGILTNTGNFSITGATTKNFRGGAAIDNSGTVSWTGTGNIQGGEGAVFNNLAGGTFDIQVNASFNGAVLGGIRTAFNNVGSVIKSAGTLTTTLDVTFNNTNGTIDVQTGGLTLSAGGNKTGGVFTVATGANLNFSGTPHVFSGSFTGAIDGIVDFVTFQIDPAGATLNFPGQGFTWNTGTITGTGILTNAGNLSITSSSSKNFRGGATINNSGTATWAGTGAIFGGESAVFNNLAGGTFDIQVNASFNGAVLGGTRTAFNNVGSVIKSIGTLTTTLDVTFNNSGTTDIRTGILSFSNGYTQQTSSSNIGITINGIADFGQHRTTAGITTLAGDLNVSLNNFTPAVGNSFQVMTFVNRNNTQFANINLPVLPSGLIWGLPVYTTTSLTLPVQAGLQQTAK